MNDGPDCQLCHRAGVRRSHGGGRVCPYCDLNETPPGRPAVAPLPNKRRAPSDPDCDL